MQSYRSSNRGLLLLLLFACFSIFSCQKDFNSESDEEQISFKQARQRLTSPTEIYFFDFSFASRTNPHVIPSLSGRDAQQSLDAFAYELLQKDFSHHYIPNLVADIGYPYWNGAITYTNSSTEKPVILLPFAPLNADAVQGILIATQLSGGIWTSHLYTRSLVDSLINIHSQDVMGLGFVVSVLIELDQNLFGKTTEKYIAWLKNIEDENLSNVLQERCLNSITFCHPPYQVVLTSEHIEERDLICHTYYFCDGTPGGGGSGSVFASQTGCYLDQYNQWICNYNGPTEGNSGGGGVGVSNGGGNGGDYISDLLHAGLMSEDLWNDLMVINGTSVQSKESMIWLMENKGARGELLAFIGEYGSEGAVVVQAVTQQGSEEARLHALEVMRFAMSGVMRFEATQLNFFINNPMNFGGLSAFASEHSGQEDVSLVIEILVNHAITNGITDNYTGDYSTLDASFPCGTCFAVAFSMEYAILSHFNPPNNMYEKSLLVAEATWNVIGNGVHLMLDVGGFVPGFGEVFDLTNGVLYLLQGDHTNASLSASAAIPFYGWTATGAKYARKVITAAGKTTELRLFVRNSDQMILFGWDLQQGRKQLRQMLGTPSGSEAHHIIPWQYREHPVIQAAANVRSNDAFHMNELLNGISLPKTLGSGLPQHLGSHPQYNNRVEESLDNILAQLGPNMSPQDALDKLTQLITNINTKIVTTNGGTINNVSGWLNP